jgi:ParB-like chromosome segregation protein Spo0J
MKTHPFADVFPMLDDAELQKLAEDIQQNGQLQPILVTKDGLILDGRNRWAACERVGITPATKIVSGDDEELLQMALGLNLHRRHLNESQRAMVADKLADLRPGQRTATKSPARIQAGGALSQQAAAKALNVSRDTVQKARKVRREASPEIVTKVERGELSVHAAVQQTKAATAPAPTTPGSSEGTQRAAEASTATLAKPTQRQQRFQEAFRNVLKAGPKGRDKAQRILTECLQSLATTSSREDFHLGIRLVRELIATWAQKFGLPEAVEDQTFGIHDTGNPEVTGV